jgi:hypothetical protein
MLRSLCLLAVPALAITISAPAHANHKVTESFKINSQGMNAAFFGSDNCAAASVQIFYSAVMTRVNGLKDSPFPTTFIEIDYQNICTGDAFLLSGTTDNQQATIRGDIGAATLSATIPVSNDAGTVSTTVTVNLSWKATGGIIEFRDKFRSNGGGVKFKQITDSESRPAEATGTVGAMLPLSTGNTFTNLVFGPSVDAIIAKNLFGQVTVTRTFPN